MSADNSCGDFPPEWQLNPHPDQAIDADKAQIADLKRQVMQLTVDRQGQQLKELEENYFRSLHPPVQDAWDQYQTVYKLTKAK